ncbi:MAG: 2Fe-2S iron-sulfur cluster-binding protein, partial [Methylotenera sp.]|nr:2Fe-2S iron-sulfur cluster-binding protein [Methylotenera sp.]
MPQIIILPHVELCPDGAAIEANTGESICNVLLNNHIDIDHACDQACACTTCHVIVR